MVSLCALVLAGCAHKESKPKPSPAKQDMNDKRFAFVDKATTYNHNND